MRRSVFGLFGGLALVSLLAAVAAAAPARDDTRRDSGPLASAAGASNWFPLRESRFARVHASGARIGRFAYTVGGVVEGRNESVGALERYDLRTGRTHLLKSMPLNLDHIGVAGYHGDLYAAGGSTPTTAPGQFSTPQARFFRYDPERNRWSRLPRCSPPGADTQPARSATSSTSPGAPGHRRRGAPAVPLASLEIYDFRRRRWSRGPDMPTARTHVGGVVAGGYFYVLGGSTNVGPGGQNLATVERYNPRRRRWARLPDMPVVHWGFGATAVGDRVVVAGGLGREGVIPQAEIYDPERRVWSSLPDMRTPRHHFVAVARRKRIYTLQGSTTPPFTTSPIVEAIHIE